MSDPMLLFDLLAALSLVGLASVTIFARRLFPAVLVFMVFGLVLALAWARLGAPDVAITEAALGAGLVGALLLYAIRNLDRLKRQRGRSGEDEASS